MLGSSARRHPSAAVVDADRDPGPTEDQADHTGRREEPRTGFQTCRDTGGRPGEIPGSPALEEQ